MKPAWHALTAYKHIYQWKTYQTIDADWVRCWSRKAGGNVYAKRWPKDR